jgi:hypothetical protein
LYKPEYVGEVLQEMKVDCEAAKAREVADLNQNNTAYAENRRRALRLAIHITTFRQFVGANVLVTFSTQIVEVFYTNPDSPAIYTSLIVNMVQLLANVANIFVISQLFGKRPPFVFGAIGATIFNFGIAFALLF